MWKSVVKVALGWIMEASAGHNGSAIHPHELAGRRPLQSPWPSLLVLRTFSVLLTFPGLYRKQRERGPCPSPGVWLLHDSMGLCSSSIRDLSGPEHHEGDRNERATMPMGWPSSQSGCSLGTVSVVILTLLLVLNGYFPTCALVSLSVQWMSSLPRALPAAKSSRI